MKYIFRALTEIKKSKPILNAIILGLFSISILLNISPAFATRPFFRVDIETIAYPSANRLTQEIDAKILQSVHQMKKAGYADDVDKLFLAYKNRDSVWETANLILTKIQNEQINSENISEYLAPDANSTFNQNKMDLVIKKIRSFGSLAILSTQHSKGLFPDRMFIKKEYSQDRISIRVLDFIHPDAKKSPISYITFALSAEPPYKDWFLSDIYISDFT